MFKHQLKTQKILSLALLLFAVVCFAFSIGITTNLYGLYLSSAVSFFDGINLFTEIQDFNHYAVIYSLILIGTCLLPFIFATNKRRLYYLDNYISSGVQAGYFIFYGAYILSQSLNYKHRFLTEVDFTTYKETAELFKFQYSESTFFFDAGIVLGIISFVVALLIVGNLVWKYLLMKKEKQILSLGAKND